MVYYYTMDNDNTYTYDSLDTVLSLNEPPIELYITPLTPYLICNHYLSTELHKHNGKYVHYELNVTANDLFTNQNYHDIQDLDIVQVQVDHFDFFYDTVLPILHNSHKRVILITSQWHLPQITQNHKTDQLLNHPAIFLWISQNPIYTNRPNYMAFPYGIHHHQLEKYIAFVQSEHSSDKKETRILNQYASVHGHLPQNHIRRIVDIFGINSGPLMNYTDYLTSISKSEFVISTPGDREDCYRHYECIGLHAIPVSNIGGGYKDIFCENMVYSNSDEMVQMVQEKNVPYEYNPPNRDIITISYWLYKIRERVDQLNHTDVV